MPALEDLGQFDIVNAVPSLWVFRGPSGRPTEVPSYTGRWVEIDADVQQALKRVATDERGRITETIAYDLLAENNEGSALTISADETNLPLILGQMAAETTAARSRDVNDLHRSGFYAVKFANTTSTLYAFRKTTSNWKTRRDPVAWAIFAENRLTLDTSPRFELEAHFDFFAINGEILILNKNRFESILSYRQAHIEDFNDLLAEPEFAAVFGDVGPLVAHVGANKIRLRRMGAVRLKAHYKNADFMTRLRQEHAAYGLVLNFDADGKIVATEETSSAIITALLDHRLGSGFSHLIYDVPSASPVNV